MLQSSFVFIYWLRFFASWEMLMGYCLFSGVSYFTHSPMSIEYPQGKVPNIFNPFFSVGQSFQFFKFVRFSSYLHCRRAMHLFPNLRLFLHIIISFLYIISYISIVCLFTTNMFLFMVRT